MNELYAMLLCAFFLGATVATISWVYFDDISCAECFDHGERVGRLRAAFEEADRA